MKNWEPLWGTHQGRSGGKREGRSRTGGPPHTSSSVGQGRKGPDRGGSVRSSGADLGEVVGGQCLRIYGICNWHSGVKETYVTVSMKKKKQKEKKLNATD